jgi:hypothetical protein
MSAPRKFDEETRARAVRLYTDRLRDHGESKLAARQRLCCLLERLGHGSDELILVPSDAEGANRTPVVVSDLPQVHAWRRHSALLPSLCPQLAFLLILGAYRHVRRL